MALAPVDVRPQPHWGGRRADAHAEPTVSPTSSTLKPRPPYSLAGALLLATALLLPTGARAAKFQITDQTVLNVGVLLQPQLLLTKDGANGGENWDNDLFLRRARLMLYGTLTDRISFFVETDQVNFGRNNDYSAQFFMQDAFVSFKVVNGLTVDAGLFLIPLSHHSTQGATALLNMDYFAGNFLYQSGRVLRDIGVQLRGTVLQDRLHYRLAATNGVEASVRRSATNEVLPTLNPEDWPRLTGQVRFNLAGKEDGFFFSGMTFAAAPVISFGLGADYQADAAGGAAVGAPVEDYVAFAADAFVDVPLGSEMEVVFQLNLFRNDQGDGAVNTGFGGMTEAGLRVGKWGVVAGVERFNSEVPASRRTLVRGGINYWFEKHQAKVQLDASSLKVGSNDAVVAFAVQPQIFF